MEHIALVALLCPVVGAFQLWEGHIIPGLLLIFAGGFGWYGLLIVFWTKRALDTLPLLPWGWGVALIMLDKPLWSPVPFVVAGIIWFRPRVGPKLAYWVLAPIVFAGSVAVARVKTLPQIHAIVHEPQASEQTPQQATRAGLLSLRSFLDTFKKEKGKYPKELAWEMRSMPVAYLPGDHAESNSVTLFRSMQDAAPGDDTGGWGYVWEENSPDFGKVWINCTHTDETGKTWDSY